MKKNRLALNTWTGIFDIVNCILFAVSQNVIWVTVFSDASTGEYGKVIAIRIFFYAMAWIGISLNIWALVQSEKHGISLVGSISMPNIFFICSNGTVGVSYNGPSVSTQCTIYTVPLISSPPSANEVMVNPIFHFFHFFKFTHIQK